MRRFRARDARGANHSQVDRENARGLIDGSAKAAAPAWHAPPHPAIMARRPWEEIE
jgi:hypothetical protein